MKNIVLILFAAATFAANAQVSCTPDPNNTNYGSTPQADEIPCVERGIYYEQVVQVLLPSQFSQATIDSFKMLTVSNLPSGINYTCGNATCTFYAEKSGCFVVYGTTTDSAKRYDIGFTGKAYIKVNGIPTTYNLDESLAKQAGFDMYLVVIEKDSACDQVTPTAIRNIATASSKINAFYAADTKQIVVNATSINTNVVQLEVFDIAGRLVANKTFTNTANTYFIESASLQKGLYLVRLNGTAAKVIVE